MKFMKYLNAPDDTPPTPKQGYKRCSACQLEKPISDFVRTASLSQSRAWTKHFSSQKRLRYESKVCNACHRARSNTPNNLTPEVYRKRLVNEGVHPAKIQALVDARKVRGSRIRAEKTKSAKLARALPQLQPLLADIRLTENKLKNKLTHLRRLNLADSMAGRFCAQYAFMVDDIKRLLRAKAKTGARLPDRWQALITDTKAGELRTAYRLIPAEHNQRFALFMLALPESLRGTGDTGNENLYQHQHEDSASR